MNYVLITEEVLGEIAIFIGYDISKIKAKDISDLEKVVERRVLELFERCNVSDSNVVEVYCDKGRVVVVSGDFIIYTDKFFKDSKVEKKGDFPIYRLPPKKEV